jgi:DNA-binding NtrC family response regulator
MLIHVLLALGPGSETTRLERLLQRQEIDLHATSGEADLMEQVAGSDFDLLLVARSVLPDRPEGLVRSVRALPERPEIVVLTDREDPEERAILLGLGCLGVLCLELSDRALQQALTALIERRRDDATNRLRADRPEEQYSLNDFVSESPTMQMFLELARKVVRADTSLLLLGETGVGKERMARAIHAEGPRSSGPFLALNCGALPESLLESELFGHEEGAFTGATRARKGYFELAHQGTIFLDEVGEIPLHLQVKLLRVLDEHRIQRIGGEKAIDVDVRVMAATNRDLEADVAAKRFRDDLFFRLAVVTLEIPPLRERREDIQQLVDSYLEHFRNQMGKPVLRVSAEASQALVLYDWPGNVRELANAIERAVLIATEEEIRLADLPGRVAREQARLPGPGDGVPWSFETLPGELLERPLVEAKRLVSAAFEKRYLVDLLRSTGGKVGETAQKARINERSLYGLMRKHGLRKERFRKRGRAGQESGAT